MKFQYISLIIGTIALKTVNASVLFDVNHEFYQNEIPSEKKDPKLIGMCR
jgi:hypothetical protein